MHIYDYSLTKDQKIPNKIINLMTNIAKQSGIAAVRKDLYPNVFAELEQSARIRSIRSSNEIEGIVTSNDRLYEIVMNRTDPLNRSEAEIAGYRDVLAEIHQQNAGLNFSEQTIQEFHRLMLSSAGYEYRGKYKTVDNSIVEFDEYGNRHLRFQPVSAAKTPQAMEQLILAYTDTCDSAEIHPLLLIPQVILDFLCIHPFQDGNGRISRLLTLLLLSQNGYDIGRYVSFEEAVSRDKNAYYDALQQSSKGWQENRNNPYPFIQHFLKTLNSCYAELNTRFSSESTVPASKSERIRQYIVNTYHPVSKSEICATFPEISPTTVEAALGKLVKTGTVIKTGSGRGTRYIPNRN